MGLQFEGKLLASPTNIRLWWKFPAATSALAYNTAVSLTVVNRFIALAADLSFCFKMKIGTFSFESKNPFFSNDVHFSLSSEAGSAKLFYDPNQFRAAIS
jgi:hypothetical protein